MAIAQATASQGTITTIVDLTGLSITWTTLANRIYRVTLDGSAPRRITIPQDGSDPDWSGVMD